MEAITSAKASIRIDRPVEEVWKGLTDPTIVEKYFFGTHLDAEWKAGGKIFFRGSWQGHSYEDKGTILAISPPRLLRYSYWSNLSGKPDVPENYVTVTYELSENAGTTTVAVIQDGVTSEEARRHSEQNWLGVLEGLKKTLDG